MYFSKKVKNKIKDKINKDNYLVFKIKLSVGKYLESEIENGIDILFKCYREFSCSKNISAIRKFDGLIRKFLVEKDDNDFYEPYFLLLTVKKQPYYLDDEFYKILILKEYLKFKWTVSWISCTKTEYENNFYFKMLYSKSDINDFIEFICSNNILPENKKIKDEKHRKIGFYGVFTFMMREYKQMCHVAHEEENKCLEK